MTATVSANEGDPATTDNQVTINSTVQQAPPGLQFYSLTPCRVLDTRTSRPALATGVPRIVQVTGRCGIPTDAVAVSFNTTAVAPSGDGYFTLFPGNGSLPPTSTVNFRQGSTRTNNLILALATDGSGTLAALTFVAGGGQVDLILDVNGFFR